MKVLCLHGKGTSGKILEAQTSSLRLKLQDLRPDAGVTFDFVNGPLLSTPAPDTPLFYDPPNYAYYEGNEVKAIREAHTWLSKLLAERGPYDGVLTFSQGCALVSSFLMYRQWFEPELVNDAPFYFAMFICGGVPIPCLKDLGVPISRDVEELDARTKEQLRVKTTGKVTRDRWTETEYAAVVRRAQFDSDDCFGVNLNKIPLELKLRIPTVHVFGERDPRLPASIQLAGFCDPYIRKVYNHGGGHEIPRSKEVSEELARLLLWCMDRGKWPGRESR